jgi:5-methylcytosine-specific restriction endonuclease McrA
LRRGLRCEHGECKRSAARARILDNPCAYCGAPAEHADHVTPLARGGLDCLENLAPACARCNLSKGSQTVDEFLERQTAA